MEMKVSKRFPEKEKFFIIFRKHLFLLIVLFLFSVFVLTGKASPKFLIFHLDAISSQTFFQNMEKGYLPNLKAVFKNGNMIHYGLSLFPGGTETIYPRLKEGWNNSVGESVGWGYYDRDKERVVPGYETWFYLFSNIPRRFKVSFIYGIPGFDFFMFLPLLNIPELLETYDVVEFIWFTTDSLGHIKGKQAQEASMRRFDRYFGKLIKRLNLDEINIILYSDHGMSFGDFTILNQKKEIKRIVGDNLLAFLHPNLYLKNPNTKDKVARDIVLESDIDFAFYRESSHQVIGCFDQGKVIFKEKEGKFQYLFEGKDAFGYYSSGYNGEWLTALEWLVNTKESRFPAVLPNLYNLFSNKRAGDIVIIINPPKIPYTFLHYVANHAGITNTDLMMPILLRGPELEHLYDREEMWLHNLFTSIPNLSFENLEPKREKNSFRFWGNNLANNDLNFELSVSPGYRWKYGIQYQDDICRSWLEYDIYSSYVMRLWTGGGIKFKEKRTMPFMQTRLQMDFGKIQFNCGWQYDREGWKENAKEIVYQINDHMALEWFVPDGLGLSFSW